jgi:hypothetical protein
MQRPSCDAGSVRGSLHGDGHPAGGRDTGRRIVARAHPTSGPAPRYAPSLAHSKCLRIPGLKAPQRGRRGRGDRPSRPPNAVDAPLSRRDQRRSRRPGFRACGPYSARVDRSSEQTVGAKRWGEVTQRPVQNLGRVIGMRRKEARPRARGNPGCQNAINGNAQLKGRQVSSCRAP